MKSLILMPIWCVGCWLRAWQTFARHWLPWPKCSANTHTQHKGGTKCAPLKWQLQERRRERQRERQTEWEQWEPVEVRGSRGESNSDDLGEFAPQLWPGPVRPGLACAVGQPSKWCWHWLPTADCLPVWPFSMRLHLPLTLRIQTFTLTLTITLTSTFTFCTRISHYALAFRIRISHARFYSLCLPSAFIKSNCENLFAISIRSHVGLANFSVFQPTVSPALHTAKLFCKLAEITLASSNIKLWRVAANVCYSQSTANV